MSTNFTASTKEVCDALGLSSTRTLHRRRANFTEKNRGEGMQRFLQPNIHFRSKSPDSPQLVWDLDATVAAWNTASKIALEVS